MNWRKPTRWFVLYPAFVLAGLHTLMTGSPVPLWHIERLNSPAVVQTVSETHLILQDGRKIALPFIKTLPNKNPMFLASIEKGIEISPSGTVYGLMWLDRNCGNDPVVWRRMRTNLSSLAGALHPSGIDDSLIQSEVIARLQENKRIDRSSFDSNHRNHHLTLWEWSKIRAVQKEFESIDSADTK